MADDGKKWWEIWWETIVADQNRRDELDSQITQIQMEQIGIAPNIDREKLPDGSSLVLKPTLVDEVCKFISEDIVTDLEGRMTELVLLRDEKLDWAASDPAVSASFDISTAQKEFNRITEKAETMVADIKKIAEAIKNYGENGAGADVLANFRDKYANTTNPTPFTHTPYVPPTPIPEEEEPLGDDQFDDDNSDTPRYYPPVLKDDEKEEPDIAEPTIEDAPIIVEPTVTVPVTESVSQDVSTIIDTTGAEPILNPTYAAKMATAFGIEDIDGDGALSDNEIAEVFSSFGASGASLIVPSTSAGGNVEVKSGATIGAAGVTLAAAAAIAGKIYYDKKHEEDEDMEDVVSDMIEIKTNATGANVGTGMMSGLNMVELKEQLLNVGEESEA